jgi:hypothetical protein
VNDAVRSTNPTRFHSFVVVAVGGGGGGVFLCLLFVSLFS